MEQVIGVLKLFFDPVNVLVGAVVVCLTMWLLKASFVNEDTQAASVGQSGDDPLVSVPVNGWIADCRRCEMKIGEDDSFFDVDRLLELAPKKCEDVAQWLVDAAKKEWPDAKICFVEKDAGPVGMVMFESCVASRVGQPVATVRVRRDLLGAALKGTPIVPGDRVVLVMDVLQRGALVAQTRQILRKVGAELVGVLCLVDRDYEKSERFPSWVKVVCAMRSPLGVPPKTKAAAALQSAA